MSAFSNYIYGPTSWNPPLYEKSWSSKVDNLQFFQELAGPVLLQLDRKNMLYPPNDLHFCWKRENSIEWNAVFWQSQFLNYELPAFRVLKEFGGIEEIFISAFPMYSYNIVLSFCKCLLRFSKNSKNLDSIYFGTLSFPYYLGVLVHKTTLHPVIMGKFPS